MICYLLQSSSPLSNILSFAVSLFSPHTSTGGLSLVGIHQGPSLSLAVLQCQWTIVDQRQSSLLMSAWYRCVFVCVCECGWVVCVCVCAAMCTCFNHAYYICINKGASIRKCWLTFRCRPIVCSSLHLSANYFVCVSVCVCVQGTLVAWKVQVRCHWMQPSLPKQVRIERWEFLILNFTPQLHSVRFLSKECLYLRIHLQKELVQLNNA